MIESEKDLSKESSERLRKLGLEPADVLRRITAEELLYLFDHCPFLQMVSTDSTPPLEKPALVTAKSGWVIHNYGDALSSSPGSLLFGGGNYTMKIFKKDTKDDDDDGDGGGIINPGKGTIFNQTFMTANEMVALAKQLGWAGIHIVDGHPRMQWAAWVSAMYESMSITGYEPSERDRAKLHRLRRSEVEDQVTLGARLA